MTFLSSIYLSTTQAITFALTIIAVHHIKICYENRIIGLLAISVGYGIYLAITDKLAGV